jgi:guanylate kinase
MDGNTSKLVIFSAPSGAGKTTIVHYLLTQKLNLVFSISACSREKRETEIDGKDYHFLGLNKFKDNIKARNFLEWEEVYPGQFYGTLKSEVNAELNKGKNVIFDVDVIGGLNIKEHYGNRALSIFVMAPSIDNLKKRLEHRSTESQTSLDNRIAKASKEFKYANQFDAIVMNDKMENAFAEATNIVQEFLNKKS